MEEKKEVKPLAVAQADPIDRLELLAQEMVDRAKLYGDTAFARKVVDYAGVVRSVVVDIRKGMGVINEAFNSQDKHIEELVAGNRKLTDELFSIKSSRLWRIYRRLIGYKE